MFTRSQREIDDQNRTLTPEVRATIDKAHSFARHHDLLTSGKYEGAKSPLTNDEAGKFTAEAIGDKKMRARTPEDKRVQANAEALYNDTRRTALEKQAPLLAVFDEVAEKFIATQQASVPARS